MLVRRIFLALLAAASVAGSATADAAFPDRPVRILVPYPPGGVVDVAMRRLADMLSKRWGVSVFLDNHPGGATIRATVDLLKSDADGYTLGIATSPFLVNPSLRKSLPYDTLRDFTGVSMVVAQSVVLLAHPSFAANNIPELVAEAKRRPQPLLYGSTGVGGIAYLTSELFQRVAGIKLINVSYAGDAKAVTDLLSGQIPLSFEPGFAARPLVEAGRLKALGVTSKERLAIMPRLATFGETYPGFEVSSIQALIAPAAIPRDVLAKLSTDVQAEVRTPEFAAQMRPFDLEPIASTPEEFNAYARREMARWKEVIEGAHIKPE